MGQLIDEFYTLSDEELYYRKLYEEGRSTVEYINLPSPVQEFARLEEKIVLSSSYYSSRIDESVIILKHPCYMPRYLHSHKFVELVYICRGEAEQSIEGQDEKLVRGDAAIIFPGYYHSIWSADEKTIALNFLISRDFFFSLDQRFSLSLRDKSFVIFSGNSLDDDVEEMLQQDRINDSLSMRFKEVLFERMILKIKRSGSLRSAMTGGERREVFRIMSYLEEHSKDATLTSFARDFGITEQYASRLIHEKTGLSFSQIVRKLRMEESCRLLRKDRLSCKQIAWMVGYSSPEHFSRTFKSYYRVSPEVWRERNSV